MYNRGIKRCYAGLSSLLRTKREPEKCPLLSRRGRHEPVSYTHLRDHETGRTRVPPKARSGRWVPQPVGSRASKVAGTFLVLFWCAKENFAPMQERFNPRHRRAIPPILPERKRANVPHGTLALSPHLCAAAVGMRTVYSMYPSRSSRCAVAGTPLSVIRRMAWSMVFTKMRTSFTIEMR